MNMSGKFLVSRAGLVVAAIVACFATIAEARESIPLNDGWRFFQGVQAGGEAPGFNDSSWQQVQVPHTWNRMGEYNLTRTAASNNYQGEGWYRLSFTAPQLARGQRAYLQFDGVGSIADVWVNGTKLGRHEGAFSGFRFDVTDAVRPGAANLVAVRADNTKRAKGSVTGEIMPIAGDFFINGGIYRNVSLVVTDGPAHIDLMDFGGPGIYAHATDIAPNNARIELLSRLANHARSARPLTLTARVRDAAGTEVASTQHRVRLARGNGEVRSTINVPNPHLWNGRADPYMYSITVELADRGKVIDSVTQPLGIRSFRFDANKGFFLNGKHLFLHGVSRHQDRMGKGWALSDADHEEDMALIAEMGANSVRGAHYQHAQKWYELGDRYGMAIWAEIPFVHMSDWGAEPPTPKLVANARQQLTELIRQSYNHPSIVTWSVGNEVNVGARPMQTLTKSQPLLKNLHDLAKQEDPSRVTTFADCCEDNPVGFPRDTEILAGTTDVIGYNRYYGWYYGNVGMMGPELDRFHKKHPGLPMAVSEYGAGGGTTQHTDNPEGGQLNSQGRPHPEEFQAWYHEQTWPQIEARSYLWGSYLWNMFDFPVDGRSEGDTIDMNDKGLVTFDRKRKKDAFYYYKAQWSHEPTVHITGSRYVDRNYASTPVRVYSNAPSVRIALNGNDLGTVTCRDAICVLPVARLKPGSNTITASADFAGKAVSDSVIWNAQDVATGLRIDAGAFSGHVASDGMRVGSDNFFQGGRPRNAGGGAMFGGGAPAAPITGPGDPAYYRNYREGSARYAIPVPNGRWKVTIYSMEPSAREAATRTFDISANGKSIAKAWSPSKAAGGASKGTTIQFQANVTDGMLNLAFDKAGGEPVIAAIEVSR
jgi:beta-galactosidase